MLVQLPPAMLSAQAQVPEMVCLVNALLTRCAAGTVSVHCAPCCLGVRTVQELTGRATSNRVRHRPQATMPPTPPARLLWMLHAADGAFIWSGVDGAPRVTCPCMQAPARFNKLVRAFIQQLPMPAPVAAGAPSTTQHMPSNSPAAMHPFALIVAAASQAPNPQLLLGSVKPLLST